MDLMIENRLEKAFNPVQPDPGFIDRLYQRLMNPSEIQVEKRPAGKILFLIGLGLFIGAFIWWVIRLFYSWIKRL
jgi:hypothetical protein